MAPVEGTESELRDYLRVVRRRKGTVALAVIGVVAAALIASFLQTAVYEARAEVLLQRGTGFFDGVPNQRPGDPVRRVQTELRVVTSAGVQKLVRAKLGVAPRISATSVSDADAIVIKASSTVPAQARAVANAYANAYIEFGRQQAVDQMLAVSEQVSTRVDDLQGEIDKINSQITSANDRQRSVLEQTLGSRRDALLTQQSRFRQRLEEARVDAALGRTGGAQVSSPASVPSAPVKPRPLRNGAVGLLAGLALGVGLAFFFDILDDSINSKEDLERSVGDVPTLGLIPAIPTWRDRGEPMVVSRSEPTSPGAEAYRSLRTSIQFMGLDRPMRTVQITSSNASEGKTTTLANLGVALARSGQRVILVCCDLRRPRLNAFFGLPNGVGFTSVLLGDVPLSAALQAVPGEQRLMLLASGPLPPNPSELLSSRRTVELLTALQANSDVVLIDSPPVLPVTDAAVLAARVDATLLVCTAGSTTRKEATRSVELLRQVDAPIVGTVLNGVGADAEYGYAYKYEYYRRDEKVVPETVRRT